MRPLTRFSLFGVRLATCVLVVYWLAMFTGTHIPKVPDIGVRVPDKVLHASAFFGLTMLLCWVIQTRHSVWKKFAIAFVLAALYAVFDEFTQGFVRGRSPDVRDFAADMLGCIAAIVLYATARKLIPAWTVNEPKTDADDDADTYRVSSRLATVPLASPSRQTARSSRD